MAKSTHKQQRAQKLVDEFNAKYPVGAECMLRTDSGTVKTEVRAAAYAFLDEIPVAFFQGIRGAYSIANRVSPVPQEQA